MLLAGDTGKQPEAGHMPEVAHMLVQLLALPLMAHNPAIEQ